MNQRLVLTIALIFFPIFLVFIMSNNNQGVINQEHDLKINLFPSPNVIPRFPHTDPSDWASSTWQSFEFSYPKEFVITDGDFEKPYFYLEHRFVTDDPLTLMRIFGISEDWEGAGAQEVFRTIKNQQKLGFTRFELEKEINPSKDVLILQYTFQSGPYKFRCYEVVKEFKKKIRRLTIMASVDLWDQNNDTFKDLINNLTF